jgi:adenylate cyclase
MTASDSTCSACGTELRAGARFCDGCGSPATSQNSAEYKQVTVLFADVVHSMDVAAAVGAERLREIMTELFDRCAATVHRYGGTVDKFTGDGIMAIFGAPIALEDHALRSCLAALDIQKEMRGLAAEVQGRDGIHVQLRVGLNSGEVIAGEIGSSSWSYTAVGHQVGMAQRMEAAAPPGGVMLSESTARLVADSAALGEPLRVHIKGSGEPVSARPLLSITGRQPLGRRVTTLVNRKWELAALTAMLDQSTEGRGCVVRVVGPAGIGKSRAVAETTAIAATRGVPVLSTYCESHTSEVPFLVLARLMRAAFGVDGIGEDQARALLRDRIPGADEADRVILEDALGIRDSADELPDIAPDARRRRLTALVNAAALARNTPCVYVIEDVHWIDPTSESLLADFLTIVPQIHSLVLITYRSEYSGALSHNAGAQTISLAPLDVSETTELVTQLLGTHPSVTGLAVQVAERAAGNPFFVEEIVRDLCDRGVLAGVRGAHVSAGGLADVTVPATLHAAIAARIDRLDGAAKQTLNAAAVIGFRFRADLLATLADSATLAGLVHAELIDQVMFTPVAEYAFHQPLIRTVAYRSQLKAGRAALHRRVAAAIAERDPDSAEENAALIAEHLEAAGDLQDAYGWHMRAANWLTRRDIRAARMAWQRARHVADQLPRDAIGRAAMRISPRALLGVSAWRVAGGIDETGYDELHQLASAAGDKASLAIGMAGQVLALAVYGRYREASEVVPELLNLGDSVGNPTLTVALLMAASIARFGTGELTEVMRLSERIIDNTEGDPQQGNLLIDSPLTVALMLRAAAGMCKGAPAWKDDVDQAVPMCSQLEPGVRSALLLYVYGIGVANGLLLPDAAMLRESAEALRVAEERGDEFALASARFLRGLILAQLEGPHRAAGFELLAQSRETALADRVNQAALQQLKVERAKEQARSGDLDSAVAALRAVVEEQFRTGTMMFLGAGVTALVESLLERGTQADTREAAAAIDQLRAVSTEPDFVLFDVTLLRLRALLARARGDEASYRDLAQRYSGMATSFGFEGHMTLAEVLQPGG